MIIKCQGLRYFLLLKCSNAVLCMCESADLGWMTIFIGELWTIEKSNHRQYSRASIESQNADGIQCTRGSCTPNECQSNIATHSLLVSKSIFDLAPLFNIFRIIAMIYSDKIIKFMLGIIDTEIEVKKLLKMYEQFYGFFKRC